MQSSKVRQTSIFEAGAVNICKPCLVLLAVLGAVVMLVLAALPASKYGNKSGVTPEGILALPNGGGASLNRSAFAHLGSHHGQVARVLWLCPLGKKDWPA